MSIEQSRPVFDAY